MKTLALIMIVVAGAQIGFTLYFVLKNMVELLNGKDSDQNKGILVFKMVMVLMTAGFNMACAGNFVAYLKDTRNMNVVLTACYFGLISSIVNFYELMALIVGIDNEPKYWWACTLAIIPGIAIWVYFIQVAKRMNK